MKKSKAKRISEMISVMLVFSMLFGMGSVFAVESMNKADTLEGLKKELSQKYTSETDIKIIDKYVGIFENDNMFWEHYKVNPQEALANVESVIMDEVEVAIMPRWYEGGVYGSNVPSIMQSMWYNRGVASALQEISSYGAEGSISGSTYDEKQETLGMEIGITTNGAYVYQVTGLLNSYVGNYKNLPCANIGIDTLELKLIQSLRVDAPVILHSIPKYLTTYYPSTATTGHYIVVKGYNKSTKKVLLSDCNYQSPYFGEHLVALQEVYNCVKNRYIVYGG